MHELERAGRRRMQVAETRETLAALGFDVSGYTLPPLPRPWKLRSREHREDGASRHVRRCGEVLVSTKRGRCASAEGIHAGGFHDTERVATSSAFLSRERREDPRHRRGSPVRARLLPPVGRRSARLSVPPALPSRGAKSRSGSGPAPSAISRPWRHDRFTVSSRSRLATGISTGAPGIEPGLPR